MPVGAIIGSTVVGAGTSLFGAAAQQQGLDKASKASTAATAKVTELQKQIFEENKGNAAPWMEAGKTALGDLTKGIANGSFDLSKYSYDDLVKDPGYQFRVDQGRDALEAGAAARGKLLSGNQGVALEDYGQKAGSGEFSNAYARAAAERDAKVARLAGVSGQGLQAAGQVANAGNVYGTNVSNAITGNAATLGANAVQSGANWANAAGGVAQSVNTGLENYMLFDRLKLPTTVNPSTGMPPIY